MNPKNVSQVPGSPFNSMCFTLRLALRGPERQPQFTKEMNVFPDEEAEHQQKKVQEEKEEQEEQEQQKQQEEQEQRQEQAQERKGSVGKV